MITPRSKGRAASGSRPQSARRRRVGERGRGADAHRMRGLGIPGEHLRRWRVPRPGRGFDRLRLRPGRRRALSGIRAISRGKVPQEVGDKWDVYWETHTLDEDGNIVDLPHAR